MLRITDMTDDCWAVDDDMELFDSDHPRGRTLDEFDVDCFGFDCVGMRALDALSVYRDI